MKLSSGLMTTCTPKLPLRWRSWAASTPLTPGFINGYTIDGLGQGGLLSRVSVWDSPAAMQACSQLDHMLAQREKLEAMVHPFSSGCLLDIMSERSGDTPTPSGPSPSPPKTAHRGCLSFGDTPILLPASPCKRPLVAL